MEHKFHYITNLCYLINKKNQVLLIMKKKGFGQGKWNGPGGKVQEGELVEQAAIREVEEETGYKPIKPRALGYLEFIWQTQPENNQICHVFHTKEYEGKMCESEECLPQWWNIDKIPFKLMWEDDIYWLKDALAQQEVKYRFYFDKNNKITNHEKI
jgi:ADP-ribose pyrophosphatase YjhB (NUDIX family)